jgi:ATP synthase protein I
MNHHAQEHHPPDNSGFGRQIGRKAERKLKARGQRDRTIWFGLGMLGIVGWSVAIPMLVCIAIGVWIDHKTHSRYSWTLMLLIIGLVIGCLNAWYWIKKEREGD